MTLLFFTVSLIVAVTISLADNPCNPRTIQGESVVCVCDFTYCDDLVREEPAQGTYVTYTSSKDGLRFKKKVGFVQKSKRTLEDQPDSELEYREDLHHMSVELETMYQSIEGFGGAVTDAAGINWRKLSSTDDFLRTSLIDSYFGSSGIGYTFIRTPIGGCDFSTRPYAYNELPENDTKLTNFTLAPEDFQYKIPMIQESMKASSAPIKVVATTWSPPRWMKTRDSWGGYSRLQRRYLQTYADYHLKFIEEYAAQGIPIWAITTTNEPMNGLVPLLKINSMGWTPELMGEFIAEHLGPTIRNSSFNATKILAVDDQRYTIPFWFNRAASDKPEALKYVDGVGVHWYGDFLTPAAVLKEVYKKHPDKFLLGTEASSGYLPYDKSVILGSWRRAEDYVSNIIENLKHMYVGWIDWNLCLDPVGGPNWIHNNVDSAIIVNSNGTEFLKQPMFYAIGHFSKFLPPGSRRVEARVAGCGLEGVAFLTPRNTTVAVLINRGKARRFLLQVEDKEAALTLEANSFTTVEMSQEDA